MMDFNGYGSSPWMIAFGSLMMLLAVGGVVLLAVWGTRILGGQRPARTETTIETLKRRLAAGEINPDEYEDTRRALQG